MGRPVNAARLESMAQRYGYEPFLNEVLNQFSGKAGDLGANISPQKQNEIIDEISNLFPNAKKGEKKTFKHPAPDSENMITNISFYFDHSDIYGDKVMLACTDRKDVDYNNLIVILRSESVLITEPS